jgi:hypothetical protein
MLLKNWPGTRTVAFSTLQPISVPTPEDSSQQPVGLVSQYVRRTFIPLML